MTGDRKRRGGNLSVVNEFLECGGLAGAVDDLVSRDLVVEMPFAPPGFPQRLAGMELDALRGWLRRSLSDCVYEDKPVIYQLADPDEFAVEYRMRASSRWAGVAGTLDQRSTLFITLADGKIVFVRDYTNPIDIYASAGIGFEDFPYPHSKGQ